MTTAKTPFQERLIADLTAEQRQAVTLPVTESAAVIAGAGTGKTRTLTRRIGWIASEGIWPLNQILAITFTNKAAAELRTRLKRIFPRPAVAEDDQGETRRKPLPHAMTFHALGARTLRRQGDLLHELAGAELPEGMENELDGNFTILDEADTVEKIREGLRMQLLDDGDPRTATRETARILLDDMSHMATQATTMDELIREYEENEVTITIEGKGGTDKGTVPAGDVVKAYRRRKFTTNTLDYGDLIQFATRIVEDHPEARPSYQHVCVDEAQDTDRVQTRLLAAIAPEGVPVYAVGDPAQSLYSWRGAEAQAMERIAENHGCRQLTLRTNFRSAANILTVANHAFGGTNEGRRVTLRAAPSNPTDRPVVLHEYDNNYVEAHGIGDWVEDHLADDATEPRHIGILARSAYVLTRLDGELTRRGIPIRVTAGRKFAQRKEIMDVVAWLKLLINPADDVACRRALTSPRKGLSDASLQLLGGVARRSGRSLLEVCEHAHRSGGLTDGRRKLTKKPLDAIQTVIEGLAKLRCMQDERRTSDRILREACNVSGVDAELRTKAASGDPDKRDQAEAQRERIDQLCEMGREHTTVQGLHDHLTVNETQADTGTSGRVTLSTVHSAKGLEWRHLWIMGFEDEVLPSKQSIENSGEGNIHEERRILHVAVTRAQASLSLSFCRSRDSRASKLSRFGRDILGDVHHVCHVPAHAQEAREG